MPLTHFICPNGVTHPTRECLEDCPRPEGRCLSLPTLHTLSYVRTYKGKPSTTQLLNPTRLEYLQITKPYATDPFSRAFALLGTRHHGKLEVVAKKIEGLEVEKYLEGDTTGILDLLEPIDNSDYRLIDYKTFGSYAVAKLLGYKDNGEYDTLKLQLQLNNYRLLVQPMGFNVTELLAQITVRDGNTKSAYFNKIDFNIIMLPVEILDDNYVKEYFLSKAFALKKALETGVTELCDYNERWGGRRCKGYCDVHMYCPEGAKVNKVELVH